MDTHEGTVKLHGTTVKVHGSSVKHYGSTVKLLENTVKLLTTTSEEATWTPIPSIYLRLQTFSVPFSDSVFARKRRRTNMEHLQAAELLPHCRCRRRQRSYDRRNKKEFLQASQEEDERRQSWTKKKKVGRSRISRTKMDDAFAKDFLFLKIYIK